jgi:hypothetical protein
MCRRVLKLWHAWRQVTRDNLKLRKPAMKDYTMLIWSLKCAVVTLTSLSCILTKWILHFIMHDLSRGDIYSIKVLSDFQTSWHVRTAFHSWGQNAGNFLITWATVPYNFTQVNTILIHEMNYLDFTKRRDMFRLAVSIVCCHVPNTYLQLLQLLQNIKIAPYFGNKQSC